MELIPVGRWRHFKGNEYEVMGLAKHSETLDEIYEKCDYITLHVPLLDSTRGMIGEEAMKRISALASPSPVLAVVRKPSDIIVEDLSSLMNHLSKGGLYLGLDTIRDPGNLGTIMRTAEGFTARAFCHEIDHLDGICFTQHVTRYLKPEELE